jgi:hypothetical protein
MSNKLEDLKDLQGLINFVYEPIQLSACLDLDSVSCFSVYLQQYNATKEIADPTIFGWKFEWPWPFSIIAGVFTKAFQALEEVWDKIKSFFEYVLPYRIRELIDRFEIFWYSVIPKLTEFIQDPVEFLKKVIDSIINKLKNFGSNIIIDIKNLATSLWAQIYNFIKPKIDEIISAATQKISSLWADVTQGLKNLVKDITDPIANTFAWLWNQISPFFQNYFFTPLKNFFFRLHRAFDTLEEFAKSFFKIMDDFIKSIVTLITNPKEFFQILFKAITELMGEQWFRSMMNIVRPLGDWLHAWWEFLVDTTFKGISAVKIPVPSETLNERQMWSVLLGDAAKFLGAMTLMGVIVSRLSNAQLGYLAAILYDMSGYKLITGAIMGALVTAAFATPLKYFYNAKYRPYLPKFGDVYTAFSRNILGDAAFKFHMKWEGLSETYFKMYERLGSDAVSPMLIRSIAEAEFVDPDRTFYLVMDRGYDVEKSIDITNALLWRSVQDYRKNAEKSVLKHFAEGYITFEEFQREISRIRAVRPKSVSFSSIDGQVWSGSVLVPLSHSELMKIAAEWDAKFDRLKEKENAIKADFRAGDIDVQTARQQLAEIIKDRNKIEDIIRSIERTKKTKEEPDRGKAIRTELKSVLRNNYKEGFITKQIYDSARQEANKITDPNILEDMLAHWEAFYDDRTDQVKTLKEQAIDGIITLEDLRKKLTALDMRPTKIDLIINDVKEILDSKRASEIAKLDRQIRSLRDKINGVARELRDLEEQIQAEENPKTLATLEKKYDKKLELFNKYSEQLSSLEEEHRILRSA